MTTRRQSGRWTALAVLTAFALAGGCGGGGQGPPPPLPALTVTTISLADGVVSQPYNFALQASGGTPPYTWSIVSQALPPGLTVSSAGAISGVPTTVGGVTGLTFQVRDAALQTATQAMAIRVVPRLTIDTSVLPPAGNIGIAYHGVLLFNGGVAPFTWSVGGGALPTGVTLNSSGIFSGTPIVAGQFNFTAQVTDATLPSQIATAAMAMSIGNQLVVTTSSLPLGVAGRPYSIVLQALGGTRPYTWSSDAPLPAGLSLNPATGELAGTPTAAFSGAITARVTDSSVPPHSAPGSLSLNINATFGIDTTTMPDGTQSRSYGGEISMGGGTIPYSLSVTGGSLPPSLSLTHQSSFATFFQFDGTAIATGSFTFTVMATDSESPPATVSRDLTIKVNPLLVFSISSLPDGVQGLPYSGTLSVAGGVAPYMWGTGSCATPGCHLPAGLSLGPSSGVISGIPTQAFAGAPDLLATDSSNPPQVVRQNVPLTIFGTLRITTSALPPVAVGGRVSAAVGTSGGKPPFTWSIIAGALPGGLTIGPTTGAIAGTPGPEGTSNFTLQVKDSGTGAFAQTATQALSLVVKSAGTIGRNDSTATATPLSNGTYQASISPFADPPAASPPNPDNDYYRLTANPGTVVRVEITADRLSPPSPLDSVIEIVDSSGKRLTICAPVSLPNGPFLSPCLNDDMDPTTLDSALFLEVPPPTSGPLTFFVHVLDFRGDARPDFLYTITISGVN